MRGDEPKTLREHVMQLQSAVLIIGISRQDFYDSTFGEVAEILKIEMKRNARNIYDQALLTASFYCLKHAGKQVPPIEDIYSNIFEPKSDLDKFREYVAMHNARNKKDGV